MNPSSTNISNNYIQKNKKITKFSPENIPEIMKEFKDSGNETTFTTDQLTATNNIYEFLIDPAHSIFGLFGYAGTGKTTLIIKLINFMIFSKHISTIAFAAPTNKAINVMKNKFESEQKNSSVKINLKFMTIHRLFNYKTDFDLDGNKIFIKSSDTNNKVLEKYKLLIIDECSMIPYNIFVDILEEARGTNSKIIFLGDPAQLPPINEEISLIFSPNENNFNLKKFKESSTITSHKYSDKQILEKFEKFKNELTTHKSTTLKQIVRNSNQGIVGLCNEIRDWIENKIKQPLIGKYCNDKLFVYKFDPTKKNIEGNWFCKYIKHLQDPSIKNMSNTILTWTNLQSDTYNSAVRKVRFGEDVKEYVVDDILMFTNFHAIKNTPDVKEENSPPDPKFFTSDQVVVLKVVESEIECKDFDTTPIFKTNKQEEEIITKYNNVVTMINESPKRKYKSFILTVTKLLNNNSDFSIFNDVEIIVINSLDKKHLLQSKKDVTIEINKFREYATKQFSSGKITKSILEEYVKRIWKNFHKIYDIFASVNYSHSMTIHKSQGSTFFNVFVDLRDILKNNNTNDVKKCIYTAITRTSNEVHIMI